MNYSVLLCRYGLDSQRTVDIFRAVAKSFSLLQNVQTRCGAHPASYSMVDVGLGALFIQGTELTTHFRQVTKLRMRGAISPLPRVPS